MKSRKIFFDISVIIIAFTLFVIWYNNSEKAALLTTASLNQNYKIYLITKDKQVKFWNFLNNGVADMSSLLGLSYTWIAPDKPDTDRQIELLNKAVDDGADAILIAANDPERLSGPIKNAKENGVKIIYVDTPAYEEAITTLETNNYDAGKIAAENMIAELEFKGLGEGKIGIVSISTTNLSTIQREQGFRDVISSDGRFTILDTAYTNGDPVVSQEEAARIIADYKDLVGLFATNEGTSEGVGEAIKADNNRIVGIGFDKSDVTLRQLEEESLKAIVVQNPYTMGYLGMAQAYAALKGFDTGPSNIDTGVSVLRKR